MRQRVDSFGTPEASGGSLQIMGSGRNALKLARDLGLSKI